MTIEKFEGSFEREELGVTQITNKAIKALLLKLDTLGLYVHLSSLPPTWEIHPRQLCESLQISKDKLYRMLTDLKEVGLLVVTEKRDQGRFTKFHYLLKIRPGQPKIDVSPCPDLPDTVLPDTVNQDAYKTKTLEIKESKKTKYLSIPKETERSLSATSLDAIQEASVKAVSLVFRDEEPSIKNTLLTKLDSEIREVDQSYSRLGKSIQNYEAFAMSHAKKMKEERELGSSFHNVPPIIPAKRKEYRNDEYVDLAPRPPEFVRSEPIARNPDLARQYMNEIYGSV